MTDKVYMQISSLSSHFCFIKIIFCVFFPPFPNYVPFVEGQGWDDRMTKLQSNIQPNSFISVFANSPKN